MHLKTIKLNKVSSGREHTQGLSEGCRMNLAKNIDDEAIKDGVNRSKLYSRSESSAI